MTTVMIADDLRAKVACSEASDDELFPEDPAENVAASRYCLRCPTRERCLSDAIRLGARHGIRGGMSEEKRAPLHDLYDAELERLRYIPLPRQRYLTVGDRMELADLRDAPGAKAKRAFRLRIGQLYVAGIHKRQLMPFLPQDRANPISVDRRMSRAVREYRDLTGIQC